jgi:hypothetical protein
MKNHLSLHVMFRLNYMTPLYKQFGNCLFAS